MRISSRALSASASILGLVSTVSSSSFSTGCVGASEIGDPFSTDGEAGTFLSLIDHKSFDLSRRDVLSVSVINIAGSFIKKFGESL